MVGTSLLSFAAAIYEFEKMYSCLIIYRNDKSDPIILTKEKGNVKKQHKTNNANETKVIQRKSNDNVINELVD